MISDKIREYKHNYYLLHKEKYRRILSEEEKNKVRQRAKDWYWSHKKQKKEYDEKYNILNGVKKREQSKKYREKHKKEIALKKSIYAKQNRLRLNKKHREQNKRRRALDPLFKLSNCLRSRTLKAFTRIKRDKPANTSVLLGAKSETIKSYIENQFLDGMNWENYGYYGWHIDHIVPLSSAKDMDELIVLCHYTNLQPLWAIENMKKHTHFLDKVKDK